MVFKGPLGVPGFSFAILLPAIIGGFLAAIIVRCLPDTSRRSEYLCRFPAVLLYGTLCAPIWLFIFLLFHYLQLGDLTVIAILRKTFGALLMSLFVTWPLWGGAISAFFLHCALRGSGWPRVSDFVAATVTVCAFLGQYLYLLTFDRN